MNGFKTTPSNLLDLLVAYAWTLISPPRPDLWQARTATESRHVGKNLFKQASSYTGNLWAPGQRLVIIRDNSVKNPSKGKTGQVYTASNL